MNREGRSATGESFAAARRTIEMLSFVDGPILSGRRSRKEVGTQVRLSLGDLFPNQHIVAQIMSKNPKATRYV